MNKRPNEESRKKKEDRNREKKERLEDDATMSFQVQEKKVRDDELLKKSKRERQDNSRRLQSQSSEILTRRGILTDVEILDAKRVSLKKRSETGEKRKRLIVKEDPRDF
jgi:hypothetical protein